MKKHAVLLCLGLLAISALAGCTFNSQVPRTTIQGKIAGQPFKVQTPKDSELQGLEVSVATNGTAQVRLQSLKTRMNPDNVSATGTAQASIISATGDLVLKSVEAGKQAGATGAAAMAK